VLKLLPDSRFSELFKLTHYPEMLCLFRNGTFVLPHSGTMTRGVGELTVTVVPDSGTGELKGLVGKMTIDIREGQHFYGFDYTLASAP